MENTSDLERPFKRARYTPQPPEPYRNGDEPIVTIPMNIASANDMPFALTFDAAAWSLSPSSSSGSHALYAVGGLDPTVTQLPRATHRPGFVIELDTTQTDPVPAHLPPGGQQPCSKSRSRQPTDDLEQHSRSSSAASDTRKRKLPKASVLLSPFRDCHERLVKAETPKYKRPQGGQVNGYVKFNWPKKSHDRPNHLATPPSTTTNTQSTPTALIRSSRSLGLRNGTNSPQGSDRTSNANPSPATSWGFALSGATGDCPSANSQSDGSIRTSTSRDLPMLPPDFGMGAPMDAMDRRLWDFYINNWCPGRSVLEDTNLWLKDFAKMHHHDGIRSAIQSLAGVYIHDYLPDERVRVRINEHYARADAHFSKLLEDPASAQPGKGDEIITMAVILSMHDIVLTEHRAKKPQVPRWLMGFQQGEHFLHSTDTGGRFWSEKHVQLSALRISQSIIVGRAVILAQPMMQLPSPATLDPTAEASRFGWLLYGVERDMYRIHGGCGFSKKLLHTISQVTYLAARLQQQPDSIIIPITAKYLHRELQEMRQWSSDTEPWDDVKRPPVIDWVRLRSKDEIINTHDKMTRVTAEAWRLATIIYHQCRVFRLPRNHPEVLAIMDDLAKCISIMPTSGSQFTAQAPLLPVFLLGLLATNPSHKAISEAWFESVVSTPVRSSVPPLYQALQRIWRWIDHDIELPPPDAELPQDIGKRKPWWERLVARVQDREEETLCLT